MSLKFQFASMLLTFTLGILFARLDQPIALEPAQVVENKNLAAPFSEPSEFQVTDLQLKSVGSKGDRVQVSYSLQSHQKVSGSVTNREIQNLLARSLKNDVSDTTRLDLVEVLKDFADVLQVRDALSYSLLNDPNPGVRMVAAESLSPLSAHKSVRDALRLALQQDVNSGVRVQAFQALSLYLQEKETQELLQNYSVKDSNSYIREQSRLLLTKQRQQTQTRI